MSHILSLAAGTLAEFMPEQVADAAGKAGFSHVGFTIDPAHWDAAALRQTKAAIAAYDLEVLDSEVIWIPEGGQLTDDHWLIVDAALELQAANILVVSAEPDKGRTAAAMHQLCERAAPGKIRVALEFLMITAVQSMSDALDIIARADHPAAALLIDTIHFQRAGHQVNDLMAVDDRLMPYTQICDGNLTCAASFAHYLEDAVDLRRAPGEGQLPVGEIIKALPTDIPLSLEIRSKAYRETFPDAVARAKAVRTVTLDYLAAADINI